MVNVDSETKVFARYEKVSRCGKHQKNFKQKLALYNYLQNIKAIKIDLEVVGLMKYDSQVNLLWIISK